MKLLQLSQQFPFPETDGGKIGIANIYRGLAKLGAEMNFVAYSDKQPDQIDLNEAEKYGRVIFINHSIQNTKSRIIKSVFDTKPIYIRKHFNSYLKSEIEKIINKVDFDIIHADHTAMAEAALFIKEITGKPASLRLHNIEWKIWDRYYHELPKSNPKYYYIKRQAALLKKFEEQTIKKFDCLLPITKIDYDYIRETAPTVKSVIASAGVDVWKWKREDTSRNPNEIIIATTYNWVHNVDGLKWFIENVLPIIKRKVPDAFLTMIGMNVPDFFRSYKDVNVLGFVPSVHPYLSRASVFITPLFVGAGIRIKILEAMAVELPTVATTVAAEGIFANEDDGLFIANDKENFAEKIVELLNNQEKINKTGEAARNFVKNNFTWDRSVKAIYDAYQEIIIGK